MSDFLGNLAARGLGLVRTLEPRLPSRFEAPPAAGVTPGLAVAAGDGEGVGAEDAVALGGTGLLGAAPQPVFVVSDARSRPAPAAASSPAAAAAPGPAPGDASVQEPHAAVAQSPLPSAPARSNPELRRRRRAAALAVELAASASPPAPAAVVAPSSPAPLPGAGLLPPPAGPRDEVGAGRVAREGQEPHVKGRARTPVADRLQPPASVASAARTGVPAAAAAPLRPREAAIHPGDAPAASAAASTAARQLPRRAARERPLPGAPAPVIQVTIGRLEVRAMPAPAPGSRKQAAPAPRGAPTLEEYLRQRSRGAGR
jgi:hypothetical protein